MVNKKKDKTKSHFGALHLESGGREITYASSVIIKDDRCYEGKTNEAWEECVCSWVCEHIGTWCVISNGLIGRDYFKNVISEPQLKGSEGNIAYTSGKSIPSRGNSKCKVPESGSV